MTSENKTQLLAIQSHIESANYSSFNGSTQMIFEEIVALVGWKSFAGSMMVEAKKDLNTQKAKSYETLIFSQRAIGMALPPSVAKDYIYSKCGDLQAEYDLAERVSANLGYYIDVLRTILSTLKQEMSTISFQQ